MSKGLRVGSIGVIPGWPPNINFTATCKLLRGCPGQDSDGMSDIYPVDSLPQCVEEKFRFTCKWKSCNRRFQTPELLLAHVERCHVWVNEMRRPGPCLWDGCDTTGRKFPELYKILVHIRSHCDTQ